MFLSIKPLKQFCIRKDKKFCKGSEIRDISFSNKKLFYQIAEFKNDPSTIYYLNKKHGFAMFISKDDLVFKFIYIFLI